MPGHRCDFVLWSFGPEVPHGMTRYIGTYQLFYTYLDARAPLCLILWSFGPEVPHRMPRYVRSYLHIPWCQGTVMASFFGVLVPNFHTGCPAISGPIYKYLDARAPLWLHSVDFWSWGSTQDDLSTHTWHLVLSHFGTYMCSYVETNLSWTCLVSGLLKFEHPSVLLFCFILWSFGPEVPHRMPRYVGPYLHIPWCHGTVVASFCGVLVLRFHTGCPAMSGPIYTYLDAMAPSWLHSVESWSWGSIRDAPLYRVLSVVLHIPWCQGTVVASFCGVLVLRFHTGCPAISGPIYTYLDARAPSWLRSVEFWSWGSIQDAPLYRVLSVVLPRSVTVRWSIHPGMPSIWGKNNESL